MLSSANIKLINSLVLKKYRDRHKLYIIEGDKLVSEFLASNRVVKLLLARGEWLEKTDDRLLSAAERIITVSENELRKVSGLKTPHNTLALIGIEDTVPGISALSGKLSIALDNIRDPGNLGTIIRIAAWFGIENIICSRGTVDVYNPKTIQATMGALIHVNVSYPDLPAVTRSLSEYGTPVYATTLDGEPVYSIKKSSAGLLLFGNESRGLSEALMPWVTKKITIPSCIKPLPGIDSLNVAMTAAIICSEFRRNSCE
ncbi:MAG: RNA methyltransferase [Bacteroidales bacterium]